MVARLNELNVPLKAEDGFRAGELPSPGRPHVARALVQGGFCAAAWMKLRTVSEKEPPGLGAEI